MGLIIWSLLESQVRISRKSLANEKISHFLQSLISFVYGRKALLEGE